MPNWKSNWSTSTFLQLIRPSQCLTPFFFSLSSLRVPFSKAIHLFLTSYQQGNHLADEIVCPSLLCGKDRPSVLWNPGQKDSSATATASSFLEGENPDMSRDLQLPQPEETGTSETREEMLWTTSRSRTVHHTQWWNLFPVNTHCSKYHYLLEMKEKDHLLLNSVPLFIGYTWKVGICASVIQKLDCEAQSYLKFALFHAPCVPCLPWNSKMGSDFRSDRKIMKHE